MCDKHLIYTREEKKEFNFDEEGPNILLVLRRAIRY